MSKPLDEVYVEIKARTDKLDKSFNELKKDFRTLQSQSKKTSNVFKSSFAKMAGGVLSLTVVFNNLKKAINAAFEQRVAEAKITQAIESTGKAAGFTTKQIKGMARELQALTGIGDEISLQGVFSQLLTFTNISGENFRRTSMLAADLATVLDSDLKSATIQLGKALNDPIANLGALGRSGIQFSKSQKEQIKDLAESNRLFEAQSIILDEIETQYGGQAKAAADAKGGIDQLNAAIGDTAELIGEELIPIIKPFLERLTKLNEEAQKNSSAFTTLGSIFRVVANAGLVIWRVLQGVGTQIGGVVAAIAQLASLNPKAAWEALKITFNDQIDNFKGFKTDFEDIWLSVKESTENAISEINKSFKSLKTKDLKEKVSDLKSEVKKLKEIAILTFASKGAESEEYKKALTEAKKATTELGLAQAELKKRSEVFQVLAVDVTKLNILLSKTKLKATVFDEAFKALDKLKEEREKLEQTGTLTNIDTKTPKESIGGVVEVSEKPLLEFNEMALITDDILNRLTDSANRAGDAMARGLTDAIFKGENLISVLGETLKMFAQIAAQSAFTSLIGSVSGGGLLGLIGGLFSSAAPDGGGGGNGLQAVTSAVNQVNGSIQNLTLQSLRQGTRPQVNNIYMDSKLVSNAIKSADNTFQGNSVDRTQI